MNKSDLVERVADATGEAKTKINEVIDATLNSLQQALVKGEKVTIPGFGTFQARVRKARTGRNPQTGAPVKIPATTIPVFKAGSALKDLVSGRAKLSVQKTAKKSAARKAGTTKKAAAAKKTTAKKSAAKKTTAKKSARRR